VFGFKCGDTSFGVSGTDRRSFQMTSRASENKRCVSYRDCLSVIIAVPWIFSSCKWVTQFFKLNRKFREGAEAPAILLTL
jgi:hypothetical protein